MTGFTQRLADDDGVVEKKESPLARTLSLVINCKCLDANGFEHFLLFAETGEILPVLQRIGKELASL